MPAAAVIPAPIAYIKVVAVKKLVVGFLVRRAGPPMGSTVRRLASSRRTCLRLTCVVRDQDFYFEEIRVFTAGSRLE